VASRLTVDLGALARNYHTLKALAAPSECGAVVKANGYGLGAAAIASRLAAEGCTTFFVATVAEGIALRDVIDLPELYVLRGCQRDRSAACRGVRPRAGDQHR
jgi:alanine racemase